MGRYCGRGGGCGCRTVRDARRACFMRATGSSVPPWLSVHRKVNMNRTGEGAEQIDHGVTEVRRRKATEVSAIRQALGDSCLAQMASTLALGEAEGRGRWSSDISISFVSHQADRSVSCARPVFGDRTTDTTSVSVLLRASVLALRSLWAKQGLRGQSFRSGIAEHGSAPTSGRCPQASRGSIVFTFPFPMSSIQQRVSSISIP